MKNLTILLLLIGLVIFGCTTQNQKLYACGNGVNVSNLSDCPKAMESCIGMNGDYCGSDSLRYFNAICDQQTGQYRYSNETCTDLCQNGKCIALPKMQNISEALDSNCTMAVYYKERKEYNIRVETIGYDNNGWCMVSYNYTPKSFENTSLFTIPSNNTMNGNCSFFNNRTGRDQETLNKFGKCEIEIMGIMLIEENYDVLAR